MDQNLNSKKDLKNLLTSILNKNKIKISLFITFLLVALITYSILNQKNKRKNILLSEKFIKAGILFSNEKKDEAKNFYSEIILEDNKFYSLLALNQIIEKNLIKDKSIILEFFSKLEKKTGSAEFKDLILFKKALYLIKNDETETGTIILNKLIEKNSNLKLAAEEIIK